MSLYSKLKEAAVRYVDEALRPSPPNSLSIIIIEHGKSGDYSVSSVTDLSLDDTLTRTFYYERANTYGKVPDG